MKHANARTLPLRTVLLPMAFVASLSGCASPSFQSCMLVGACSSTTTQASTLQRPTEPLRRVCIARPVEPSALPIRVMAPGAIGENAKKIAQENARQIVKLYVDNAQSATIEFLQTRGVAASMCSADTPADTFRLVSALQGVTTDTGGLGWRTRVSISASLLTHATGHTVWQGNFETGNRLAVTVPELDNVKEYAENLVTEVAKSGWFPQ